MTGQINQQNNRFCINCGTQLQAGMYCHACGTRIEKEEGNTTSSRYGNSITNSLPDQDTLALFVGKNAAYYMNKWGAAKGSNVFVSWNWAAFLGGIFWLSYRKMYFYTSLLLVLILITAGSGLVAYEYAIVLELVPRVLLGMFGNALYYHHTRRKLLKIGLLPLPTSEQHAKIKASGGIKWLAVPLPLIIVFAVSFFTHTVYRFLPPAEPVALQSDTTVTTSDNTEVQQQSTDGAYLNLNKTDLKSLINSYTERDLAYEEVTDGYILMLNNASDTFSFTLTGEDLDHVESVLISLNPTLGSNVELLSAALFYLLKDESEFNEVAGWLDNQIRAGLASGKDMLNSDDPFRNNLELEDKTVGFAALFYDEFMITISRK